MSPLGRAIGFLLPLLFLSGFSCSDKHEGVIFDPAVGHPGDWIEDHGPASLEERNNCTDCHGDDQGGGDLQCQLLRAEH
jgi:hypothetical protein